MSHCVELSSSYLYPSMSTLLYSRERQAKLEADVTLSPSFSLLLRINMLTKAASRSEFLSAHSPRLQPITGGRWRSRDWKQLFRLHALQTTEKEHRCPMLISLSLLLQLRAHTREECGPHQGLHCLGQSRQPLADLCPYPNLHRPFIS